MALVLTFQLLTNRISDNKMVNMETYNNINKWYLGKCRNFIYSPINNAFNSVASLGFILPAKTKLNCLRLNAAS